MDDGKTEAQRDYESSQRFAEDLHTLAVRIENAARVSYHEGSHIAAKKHQEMQSLASRVIRRLVEDFV